VNAQILAVVVLAAFLAVVVCSLFGAVDTWLRKRNPGPDVGVDIVDCGMVADLDEDIQQPSLEAIDLALRHMDRDNAGAVDWLLEKRLAEMQRRAAS
jgi:hypothetical protein